MTLSNWDILLPQISIITLINSISTWLTKSLTKHFDTRWAFINGTKKIQPTKIWTEFKPHFRIANQELKDVSDETVPDTSFQLEHIVEQVVEGLANIFKPSYDDTENNLLQMANANNQSTQMMPQLVHKIQQMQTLLVQMQNNLNNNNNNSSNGGNYNSTVGDKNQGTPLWR